MQWMKRYCDSVNSGVHSNYNPLERRESCKGGKEVTKRAPPTQTSSKSSSAAPKTQASHTTKRNDANPTNVSHKPARSAAAPVAPVYDEQITELKLCVDSLEKERDFYFAKLRDIEILCQKPDLQQLPIVRAIQRVLYATDDNPFDVEEAQAMVNQQTMLSPIPEVSSEEKPKQETHKRKDISTFEFDMASNLSSSPRQRLSDISNVGFSDSPLTNC